MRSIQLGRYLIDDDSLPFFISEIGSNHQGNTEYCKELISASKNAGASAVKLQKRDNKTFYSEKLFNEPYNNPNSFAPTYGQHREFLDLKLDQWKEVIEFSRQLDKLIVVTRGEKGAVAIHSDKIIETGIHQNLNIIDLTGAGDLFAAGYLHGVINNMSIEQCLQKGTELSSKIIQKIGARI